MESKCATGSHRADTPPHFILHLRDSAGLLLARLTISADDIEVPAIAAVLYAACSDTCSYSELWSGRTPVAVATRHTGIPTAAEVSSRAQQVVLDREIALRDSRTRIAESKRLLRSIKNWSAAIGH